MRTDRYGVIDVEGSHGKSFPATNLERTLVGIAVRSVYSGGVAKVQNAYRLARGRLSVISLAKTLQDLGSVYPYHQVIGFYLERAGFSEKEVALFSEMEQTFDFYLTHGMKERAYSQKWRLYYPADL